MDLVFAFIIFIGAMIASVIKGVSMIAALLLGLAAFSMVGIRRGFSPKALTAMGWHGIKESLVVLEVMAVIGLITAIWRISGTITIFVYYGMKLITPSLFLLITFLLSCLLSYALGTSFGVAGTVGVIFMALARSGGVDPMITAGVVMSGIYFGDRGAPASSSANLVAGITNTKLYENVKRMMKTAMLPFLICFLVYSILSVMNPISRVDIQLIESFESAFVLSPLALIPAGFMLILPILKVNVLRSMGISIVSGIFISYMVQKVPLGEY